MPAISNLTPIESLTTLLKRISTCCYQEQSLAVEETLIRQKLTQQTQNKEALVCSIFPQLREKLIVDEDLLTARLNSISLGRLKNTINLSLQVDAVVQILLANESLISHISSKLDLDLDNAVVQTILKCSETPDLTKGRLIERFIEIKTGILLKTLDALLSQKHHLIEKRNFALNIGRQIKNIVQPYASFKYMYALFFLKYKAFTVRDADPAKPINEALKIINNSLIPISKTNVIIQALKEAGIEEIPEKLQSKINLNNELAFSSFIHSFISPTQTIQTFTPRFKGNYPSQFILKKVLGDGDCAAYALNTTRDEFAKVLLKAIKVPEKQEKYFDLLADEIISLLQNTWLTTDENDRVQKLANILNESTALSYMTYQAAIKEADEFISHLKPSLAHVDIPDLETLIVHLQEKVSQDRRLEANLKEAISLQEVKEIARAGILTPENIQCYVERYIRDQDGRFDETFISYKAVLIYAEEKNMSIRIWRNAPIDHKILVLAEYLAPNDKKEPHNIILNFENQHFDQLLPYEGKLLNREIKTNAIAAQASSTSKHANTLFSNKRKRTEINMHDTFQEPPTKKPKI